jgi:S-formylglutathione hydrolase
MSSVTLLKTWKCFGGTQRRYRHTSSALGKSEATFQVFLPPSASPSTPAPVLLCLAGLTCTDETFLWKSGAQRYAAEHGVALVCPDTSPRLPAGANLPGETTSGWDFGAGAGFYLTATHEPWAGVYDMYGYVTRELPATLAALDASIGGGALDLSRMSVMGHSMGGLGALNLYLKGRAAAGTSSASSSSSPPSPSYVSASAFAPIVNPSAVPWGVKAFTGYLGAENKSAWAEWDPTELIAKAGREGGKEAAPLRIRIDLGDADEFLAAGQVVPDPFLAACKAAGVGVGGGAAGAGSEAGNEEEVTFSLRAGYDHSYFFIQTFVGEHIAWHAALLKK